MAKQTVATTNQRIDTMEDMLKQLIDNQAATVNALRTLQATVNGSTTDKPKPKAASTEKPFVSPCPEYATTAQREQYAKLADKAIKQRAAIEKATGCKVTCFIPVSRQTDVMPHSIQWKATYSK